MNKAKYIAASDALDRWRDELLSGKPPTLYPLGSGDLGRIECGPGLVTLIGGAPGAGKTAFTMQAVVDALRLTPGLRALVCNCEMPAGVLLDRQLSRLAGVDLTAIRYRRIGAEHADRIEQGMNTLAAVTDRLCFLRPPFDLANVAAAADEFGAGLLLLDYIQRILPPGQHDDRRNSVNASMDYLRQFADADVAVVVVSAVGRSRDSKGRSSYAGDGLSLASFRESSELEFGSDDAFILHPERDQADNDLVKLRHLKSRHGECCDLLLHFDRAHQLFTPRAASTSRAGERGITPALAAAWNEAAAQDDGEPDDE